MDQDMITDITLDHLPDLSDQSISISFQIPSGSASADLLLADRTDGFDLLRNAVDDDVSFAPVALTQIRGLPLTLGELTPKVQVAPRSPRCSRSPTPTQVPSSSAKPSVIQRPLTLGHHSPAKHRKTPSRTNSRLRQLESPLVSSERFHQLREQVETLGQDDETPPHVQVHVVESAEDSSVGCTSSSHAESIVRSNAPDSPLASEDLLDPIPEEKDIPQDIEPPADQDLVVATHDDCPADATNIAVPAPRQRPTRDPRKMAKPIVAAGGISKRTAFPTTHVSKKSRGKPSRVREAHPVHPCAAPQPTPAPQSVATNAEEALVPPACIGGDIDSTPENTQITHPSTVGLADRLVSYSQKLISSIGLYKPFPESSFIEVSTDSVGVADRPPAAAMPSLHPPQSINDIPSTHNEPLRLSEISPHKPPCNAPRPGSSACTETLQDGREHPMSPMRPAKKRISTDADQPQEHHRRKRGKIMLAAADSVRGSSDEVVSQAQPHPAKKGMHEDPPVTHSETRDSTYHPGPSKSTLPSARTKYRPKLTSSWCKGPTLDAFPYSSGSRQVQGRCKRDAGQSKAASFRSVPSLSGFSANSRARQEKTIQEHAIASSNTRQRSGPTSTADLPLIEKKPNATLSVAQLTKPVGFTFRVDARLEARKTEERLAMSEPGQAHPPHPVPEIKAHRASHPVAFTFHREGVVPSIPVVPFLFCTEQRAKEREKFDEVLKRKEEDMQKLKEEERRREAEEEERAIKELRRKAIPKANEIPEWYADMPKRKGRRCESDVEETR